MRIHAWVAFSRGCGHALEKPIPSRASGLGRGLRRFSDEFTRKIKEDRARSD
jgi:hypothetical protein